MKTGNGSILAQSVCDHFTIEGMAQRDAPVNYVAADARLLLSFAAELP
jgi:hypothetical protein